MADVHYLTLSDVCRRIKSGELTSVHVTEALLARIGALDDDLKSYVKVLSDAALASAERHDQDRHEGKPLGHLHGVPIAVKDLLYTRGVATASGTKVMENFVPLHRLSIRRADFAKREDCIRSPSPRCVLPETAY